MTVLRWYQKEAVDAVFRYWERPNLPDRASPLVCLPTGSGKSATLGELCRLLVQDFGCRVVVATHRAELIRQDTKAILDVWPTADVGTYSASIGVKQIRAITVAGIQSASRNAEAFGHVDVVIIDECHMCNFEKGTHYAKFLDELRAANADLRLVGLTATPYRTGQGLLTQGEGALFSSVVYSADICRLIDEGFLSPLTTASTSTSIKTEGIATVGGDFATDELELAALIDEVTDGAADDIAREIASGRTSALVFGVSVTHTKVLRNALQIRGLSADIITGDTQQDERQRIINDFKERRLHCIVSCDVLTTGFDAPVVDVLAVLRPTKSVVLYVQIMGRGMRLAPGKNDCRVLDYGGNIARHGPIDHVRMPKPKGESDGEAPLKSCPQCMAEVSAAARECEHCGYLFPAPEKKANKAPSKLKAIAGKRIDPNTTKQQLGVVSVDFSRHRKKDWQPGMPDTLKVNFHCTGKKWPVSTFVCIEHESQSGAHWGALKWWETNVGTPMPDVIEDAIVELEASGVACATSIFVIEDGDFLRVIEIVPGVQREPGCDDDYVGDHMLTEEEIERRNRNVILEDDDLPF